MKDFWKQCNLIQKIFAIIVLLSLVYYHIISVLGVLGLLSSAISPLATKILCLIAIIGFSILDTLLCISLINDKRLSLELEENVEFNNPCNAFAIGEWVKHDDKIYHIIDIVYSLCDKDYYYVLREYGHIAGQLNVYVPYGNKKFIKEKIK